MKANHLSHPYTNIFYYEDDAKEFINKNNFPIVGKINIGASGSGVEILRNHSEAELYIKNAFSLKGVFKKVGPKFFKE